MSSEVFWRSPQVAGLVTVAAMLLAFVLGNSPAEGWYVQVHHLPVLVQVGDFSINKPLILWINDGLMVFFFLLIALELKREVLEGELSSLKSLAAPGCAALGGMLVPALIYAALNAGDPLAMRGWAIPVATDAVLALTVLILLGSRVPASLKVFLTALAIFDDLGAILVIALFYTEQLATSSLLLAGLGITALGLFNFYKVTRIPVYVIVGVFLWLAVLKSGMHATIAGVAIGLAIPMRVTQGGKSWSPVQETAYALSPWVALGVVPVFAFFNSGIPLSFAVLDTLATPASLGIMLGLFVGKQIGVFGATWLAVRLGLAQLPHAAGWWHIYGVALLAGIGFTMSLFIAGLAFSDPALFRSARLSVVVGSLASALLGAAVLWWAHHRRNKVTASEVEPFP